MQLDSPRVIALDGLVLEEPSRDASAGARVLEGLMGLCAHGLALLHRHLARSGESRLAAIGRVRGTGSGVSFGGLVRQIEQDLPLPLRSPFERCDSIAGGVWDAPVSAMHADARLAQLRFEAGTGDLSLRAHEHADRFVIVLEGRGAFHVSPTPLDRFDGRDVRTIPVRSRDALAFVRGVLHTFSTSRDPLVLLSFQSPFIPFDDPRQYTVATPEWRPSRQLPSERSRVACDPAWSVLARG